MMDLDALFLVTMIAMGLDSLFANGPGPRLRERTGDSKGCRAEWNLLRIQALAGHLSGLDSVLQCAANMCSHEWPRFPMEILANPGCPQELWT
jgi:hypothetical protein